MVGWVQAHLEAIYGLRRGVQISEYLVDEAAAKALGGNCRAREELLVYQAGEEGELELALFIAPELIARLKTLGTGRAMADDLGGYCQLAEGVSHFLYITHTASLDRKVSLLELEAQAEVDKFAACVLQGWNGDASAWANELIARLFDRVTYWPDLSPDESWRYQEANRLARGYCRRLLPHVTARRMDRLLAELRYSYRLGAEAKLRHLNG